MRKIIVLLMLIIPLSALADAFVPEFSSMKNLRCDFEEVVFDANNNQIAQNKKHRLFRLDIPYSKIYDNREPVDRVIYYGEDKIEFNLQSMNDDSITMSNIILDLVNGTYTSVSEITYDDVMFGVQHSKASGICRYMD